MSACRKNLSNWHFNFKILKIVFILEIKNCEMDKKKIYFSLILPTTYQVQTTIELKFF